MSGRIPLEIRFREKYRVDESTGCWVWIGAVSKKRLGYGRIQIGAPSRKCVCAHRLSWEFIHGPVPEDKKVLHNCDNSLCVNPEHMYLGTQENNVHDAMKRGRFVGLKPEKVLEVRRMIESGMRTTDIARSVGVGLPVISRIRHKNSYRCI